jgi:hypothetical protein
MQTAYTLSSILNNKYLFQQYRFKIEILSHIEARLIILYSLVRNQAFISSLPNLLGTKGFVVVVNIALANRTLLCSTKAFIRAL